MARRFHADEAEAWIAANKARLMALHGKDEQTVDMQYGPGYKAAMNRAMLRDIPIEDAFKEISGTLDKQLRNSKLEVVGRSLILAGYIIIIAPIVIILLLILGFALFHKS